ncbi:O-antigen ligase family protein [Geobacillus sp. BK01]|uniref:O-antigen ligase family protein n=1 Tax=Geobacillus sp. BK01 TaxID=3457328 RepID=UPI003FA552A5
MRRVTLYLVCVFVFVIPIENIITISGLGTISKLVGALLFFVVLLYTIVIGKIRRIDKFDILFFVFIVWGTLTYFWSFDKILSAQRILTNVQLLIMIWILREFLSNGKARLMILQSYVLGAMVSVASVISSYVQNKSVYGNRFVAQGFDPNDLGLILALSLPIAWYLSLKQKNSFINRVYIPLGYFSIILTASRTSFVVSLIGLLYIFITFHQLSKKSRIIIFLAVLLVSSYVYNLIPEASVERLSTISKEVSNGDLNDRTNIWKCALTLFYVQWANGVGIGAFRQAVLDCYGARVVAHNTFISILVEQGVIGFFIFSLVILYLVYVIMKFTDPEHRVLHIIFMIMLFLGVNFLTWEYRKVFWLILAIMASGNLHKETPSLAPSRYEAITYDK